MKKFRFSTGGKDYRVEVEDPSSSVLVIMVNGKGYTVCREDAEVSPLEEPQASSPEPAVAALTATSAPNDSPVPSGVPSGLHAVRAPIPGKILSVAVAVGDRVRYGDALCTLEAMKMESVIRAPINGLLQQVRIKEGDNVQYDDVMFLLGNPAD